MGTLEEGTATMDPSQLPSFVATKLALLSDARAAAAVRDNELSVKIADLRARLLGHVQRAGDDSVKLSSEVNQLLAEQKTLQAQRPIDDAILESCKAWLKALPAGTFLDEAAPQLEDGLSLATVRSRIKKLKNTVAALKAVPVPAPDLEQKIRARHCQHFRLCHLVERFRYADAGADLRHYCLPLAWRQPAR
jgi:hypothetical protein